MRAFDTVIVVDWSGGRDRGPTPVKDAIWVGVAQAGQVEQPVYLRSRRVAEEWLISRLEAEKEAGRRVMAAFDFPFGYPAGVAERVAGGSTLALWDWLDERIEDDAAGDNNRYAVAEEMSAAFPGVGPFWSKPNGLRESHPGIPWRKAAREGHGAQEWRSAERAVKGAFSCWQLAGAGAVGSQVLTGLPVLARLRRRLGAVAWPLEAWREADLVLTEVWPGLIRDAVARSSGAVIRDAAQVTLLARALSRLTGEEMEAMMADVGPAASEEGWILGAGHEARLTELAGEVHLC